MRYKINIDGREIITDDFKQINMIVKKILHPGSTVQWVKEKYVNHFFEEVGRVK
jgi:hypothetical protein